jgi:D-xylose transport system substrate-binding protein
MRKALFAVAATAGLLAVGGAAGCTDKAEAGPGDDKGTQGTGGVGKIGVVLPDITSSVRWSTQDSKYLKAAFDQAHIPVELDNAQGDAAKFVKIADRMIANGAKVLIIASLDAASGSTVLQHARAAKVKTIDYDRLTLGGGADYYVSFDNVQVGRLQGQGLAKCLSARKAVNPVVVELNGSPSDNNATLFKQGYDSVLQPKYDDAVYTKGPDQPVPKWDPVEGGAIFTQMLEQQPKVGGVLSANDGLAGAVIKVLKKKKMNGKVPVTGQDASGDGLRAILAGDQCMTVYKAIKPEAEAAAALAISLYRNQKPTEQNLKLPADTHLSKIKDPDSGTYLPFVSLTPKAITLSNVQDVIDDHYADVKAVCKGSDYQRLCKKHKIGPPRTPSS